MTNYEELVKALRCKGFNEGCENCAYIEALGEQGQKGCKLDQMIADAAAAIEALQEQLPKRGEIVRCRECRWGYLCVTGQHLGLDGFCSKGEREVQE